MSEKPRRYNTRTYEQIEATRTHIKTVKKYFGKKYKNQITEQLKMLNFGSVEDIQRLYHIHEGANLGTNTTDVVHQIKFSNDGFIRTQYPKVLESRMNEHNHRKPGPKPPQSFYDGKTDQQGVPLSKSPTKKGQHYRQRKREEEAKQKERKRKPEGEIVKQYTPEAREKRKKRAKEQQKKRKVIPI